MAGHGMTHSGANRRQVMTWGMMAAAFGALLPRGLMAATPMKADCITVLYKTGDGQPMDFDTDLKNHILLLKKRLGDAVSRIELRKSPTPPNGAPPAQFVGVTNMWIDDLEALAARMAQYGEELQASVADLAPPVLQYDELQGAMGQPRDAVMVGDSCINLFYANDEGVRWDVEYYRTHHMPLIMELFGAEAIKRFELRRGQHGMQPGSKAAYIGSVNIYVNDQAAFGAAGGKYSERLNKDVENFSSIPPMGVPTIVHTIV